MRKKSNWLYRLKHYDNLKTYSKELEKKLENQVKANQNLIIHNERLLNELEKSATNKKRDR